MEQDRNTIASVRPYSYHTFYPLDINGKYTMKEAYDLLCQKCNAEEIVILKEAEGKTHHRIGDTVQCWICKHEFIVTENCWKWRKVKK
jgi:hypothetical protein